MQPACVFPALQVPRVEKTQLEMASFSTIYNCFSDVLAQIALYPIMEVCKREFISIFFSAENDPTWVWLRCTVVCDAKLSLHFSSSFTLFKKFKLHNWSQKFLNWRVFFINLSALMLFNSSVLWIRLPESLNCNIYLSYLTLCR